MMVDMGVQTSFVSDFSIEASRPVQQVVVTKNAEEDVVLNDKACVGFPVLAVKGHQVEVDPAVVWASSAGCQRCLARRPSRRKSKGRWRSGRRGR